MSAIARRGSSGLARLLAWGRGHHQTSPSSAGLALTLSRTPARAFWAYNSASPVNSSGHIEWDYRGQRGFLPFNHVVPRAAVDAFIAPNAVLIGNVVVHDFSSVWFGSVLRGDLNRIVVGPFSNVQDNCVIHAAPTSPTGLPAETSIGRYSSIGAYSTLRSCTIEDEVIIGQRCVIMEGALVETHGILESGSVVPPGRRIPAGELWAGNPAKFVRRITPDEVVAIVQVAEAIRFAGKRYFREFLPYSTACLEAEKLKKLISENL